MKNILIAFFVLILFNPVETFAQTYSIDDAYWMNGYIVDQDQDNYTASRILVLNITASIGTNCYIRIYKSFNGGSNTTYYTSTSFFVSPGTSGYPVGFNNTTYSMYGPALNFGIYDFAVELHHSSTGLLLASRTDVQDNELKLEKFETTPEDQNLSDLIVQNLQAPSIALAGATISVGCRVTNIGLGASGPGRVGYYLSPTENGTSSSNRLDYDSFDQLCASSCYENKTQNITIPTGTTPGAYYIVFFADYREEINEGNNENNNIGSLSIAITGPTGDLTVSVNNIGGTGNPLPGSNGIVRLYNSSNQQVGGDQATVINGSDAIATFSNITPGSGYYVKVYHNPPATIFGSEYWGQTSGITINSGSNSVTHNRNLPYNYEILVYNNGTGQPVTGQNVPLGTVLKFEVYVKNPGALSYLVQSRLVIDKEKIAPYPYDHYSNTATVNGNNATQTLIFSQTYTPTELGDFYGVAGTETYTNSQWNPTNGDPWNSNKLFGVYQPLGGVNFGVKHNTAFVTGALIRIYSNPAQVGVSGTTGYYLFQNVPVGTHNYDALNQETENSNQELWGSGQVTIVEGTSPEHIHIRDYPFLNSAIRGNQQGTIIDGFGGNVNVGSTFNVEAYIKNGVTWSGFDTRLTLDLDRDQTGGADNEQIQSYTFSANQSHWFSFPFTIPLNYGGSQLHVKLKVETFINGNWQQTEIVNYSEGFYFNVVGDNTPPTVASTDPTTNQTNVNVNSQIFVDFSEDVLSSSVNTNTFQILLNGQPISGTIEQVGVPSAYKFIPSQPLLSGHSYSLKLNTLIEDLSGNHLQSEYISNFSTAVGIVWSTDTQNSIIYSSDSEDAQSIGNIIQEFVIEEGISTFLEYVLGGGFITGLIFEFFSEMPVTMHGAIERTYSKTVNMNYATSKLFLNVNEDFLPIIFYSPGDENPHVLGVSLNIEKKVGLFSWQVVQTVPLITMEESNTTNWSIIYNQIIPKNPITISEPGIYRMRCFNDVSESHYGKIIVSTPEGDIPTCQIINPNSGILKGIISVEASASDNNGIAYVEFQYSIDNINWMTLPVGNADDPYNDAQDWYGENEYGFSFDSFLPDPEVDFEGNLNSASVRFRARSVDLAGNLSPWDESDQLVGVDNDFPISIYNSDESLWNSSNPNLDIDFLDNLGLKNIWYQLNSNDNSNTLNWHNLTNDGINILPGSQNNLGTSLTTNWKISDSDWSSLTINVQNQGSHYIYFKITDDADNIYITQNQDDAFNFRKDTYPPNVTYTYPEENQVLDVSNVTVQWYSDDIILGLLLSGIDKHFIAIDQNQSFTELNSTVHSFSFNSLSEGIHTVFLKATDNVGNESGEKVLHFEVNTETNPPQTITDILPINKIVGSSGFTLTVNGTNFIASSVVGFNGNDRVTTYVSATQLTASILASDLAIAGSYPITVFNPAPGGGTSNSVSFTVNNIPIITITSPLPDEVFTTSIITVEGTASDPEIILQPGSESNNELAKKINSEINLNSSDELTKKDSDAIESLFIIQVRVNSGSWINASGTTNWNVDVTLNVGENLIEAWSVDNFGVPSQITSVTVNYIPNQVPTLTWTGEPGYESDGVEPNSGDNYTEFNFWVYYDDADEDAPQSGYPKIHIKKNGEEITNSPFTMFKANPIAPPIGKYQYLIGGLEVGSEYSFQFEAKDINDNQATGEATVEQFIPQINQSSLDATFSSISISQIVSTELSNGYIPGSGVNNLMHSGAIVCYKTSDERYGKLIVKNNNWTNLTIKWVTFNNDGSIYNSQEELVIISQGYFDLDEGIISSVDGDFRWYKDQFFLNSGLEPQNGGLFGIYEIPPQLYANVKLFLEGPYNGAGAMTTTLNTNNLIPLNSDNAYPTATYAYTASVVGSIPNSNIVDWVFVELRTGTASGTIVATRAAFLISDGTVVDVDGSSPVTFTGLSDGNYFVVVKHRNHLAIMTATAITLSGSSSLYDFTISQSQAYTSGSDPMVALTAGGFGMIAADANSSAIITAADVTPIIINLNLPVYDGADINMSAIVTAADVTKIISNLNKTTNVP